MSEITSDPNNQIKKIKYKFKKVNQQDNIKMDGTSLMTEIVCSYDFLIYKFGKSIGASADGKSKAEWIIIVKTSNGFEYPITIYDWKDCNIDLKDITNWHIGGKNYEFIDYNKLAKLFKFEYSNYLKQQEKINKKKELTQNQNQISQLNNLQNQSKFIDINKFKKLDNDKLKEFTDDELACVLFTRFKESNNFLLKEALIIHRALEEPENYNITTKYYNNDKNKSNKIIIIKDKSKYNNTKNKT